MTPITADMLDETPMLDETSVSEPPCSKPEQVNGASMNGHQAELSPTVAQAIAERELKAILEAMLFVSPEPLSLVRLAAALGDVTKAEVERVLRVLGDDLEQEGRGVRLAEIAGGFRLVTKQEYSSWVKRLDKAKSTAKLSRSALESLAIIAYKQPIVRSEIEEIRGVETSGVVRTLLERKMVRIVGRKEVPGRPIMYGTTKYFLEHFGLNDLSQLPPLREFKELGDAEQSLLPMEERATTDEGAAGASGGVSRDVSVDAASDERDEAALDLQAETRTDEPIGRLELDETPAVLVTEETGQKSTNSIESMETASSVVIEEAADQRAESVDTDDPVACSLEADLCSDELSADGERKIDEELMGEPVE